MPTFQYKAYTRSGAVERGEIVADTRRDASIKLNQIGLLPFECAERSSRSWISFRQLFQQGQVLPTRALAEFTRSLAAFAKAELPIDVALRLMAQQAGRSPIGKFSSFLHTKVTAGQGLADAIEAAPTRTPAMLASVVRAGEASGQLHTVLSDLATYFESRNERREKVLSALIYPVVLVVAALAAILIILKVLIPALLPLFEQSATEAPLALRMGAGASAFIDDYGIVVLLAAIVLLMLLRPLLRHKGVAMALDNVFLRLPIIGAQYRKAETALIARSLGVLLSHGVSLVSALQIASNTASSPTLQRATNAATERIKEGRRLPLAMADTKEFPEVAIQMVSVGDEIGKLDTMLLHYAELTDKEVQRTIERAMELLSPALTVAIGIVVGGLFVSVVQALLSVNDMVAR